jgi:hypothetical protein
LPKRLPLKRVSKATDVSLSSVATESGSSSAPRSVVTAAAVPDPSSPASALLSWVKL